ncbi:hypothetical protein CANARDRAFT_195500 [[Candida] arabinofermentans NRRL YB-2248]|uniref:Metallo-beta-lactamase domain-containing protein n=1 Tax=[Candida] arabinofermentans NRRL YB-2248 TaxID=983967 RepID=A0A1E4T4T6_9ASCO|nr:hypothetical protein CANARDRAFT_195500 [[Candida] arabinofermentans NRRL YB-2248]
MLGLKAKLGLGILVTYSTYSTYTYFLTQREIQKRHDDHNSRNLKPDTSRVARFLPMLINGRFENPFTEYRPQTIFEFFAMRILELFEPGKKGGLPKSTEELRKELPIREPDFELIKSNHSSLETPQLPSPVEDSDPKLNPLPVHSEDIHHDGSQILPDLNNRLTFTWFGQSCSLFQISNLTFLTDPLFENHLVSKLLGPKRITESPVSLDELVEQVVPDYVMVSHDHPDHFEESAIKKLGNRVTWIVPVGIKRLLSKHGVSNVIEMSWWDRVQLPVTSKTTKSNGKDNDIYEVVCIPAMHWSGRCLLDTNSTLWCSFLVLKNGKSVVLHCGDTGYSADLFKSVGEIYQPITLGLLPIGQYCPQWHQKPRHIDPAESLQIMEDLKINRIVGVHWGTFILSSEKYLEPKQKLLELAEVRNLQNRAVVPDFGKTIVMEIDSGDSARISTMMEARNGKCIIYR